MLLDAIFEVTGGTIFLVCFALAVLTTVGISLYKSDENSLRKAKPYLAAFAFLLLAIFGRPVADSLSNLAFGVSEGIGQAGNDVNATGAAISAAQAVSGWVPIGTIVSKLFISALFFLFFVLVMWLTQKQTHPAPTKWAKDNYSADFDARQPLAKFEIYQRIRLHYIILAAASIIGACLIQ